VRQERAEASSLTTSTSINRYDSMIESWIILSTVTFIAATLQTVTGFGFGLLCVPVFLWVLDSVAAIHLVTLVTLVMSLAILPSARTRMVPKLLIILSTGVLVGSPLGILFSSQIDLSTLKATAAVVILSITLWNAYQYLHRYFLEPTLRRQATKGSGKVQFGVGIASGVLGATLAMPAPLVMMYLSGTSYTKDEIRNTILVFFVVAYGVALGSQMAVQTIEPQTWKTAFSLCPVALFGVWLGHKLSKIVSPLYFRLIVFVTLIITSIAMLASVLI
jgi:uncharacterized membrane protein YfcA